MKLRVLPTLLSLVITSAVLFGGWFLYDSLAMESPMKRVVENVPGVNQPKLTITADKVTVQFKPASDVRLRQIAQTIQDEAGSLLNKRQLELKPEQPASPELEAWWSGALFDVAQAMEQRSYANIPAALEQRQAELPGLEIVTEMDENYVYVQLKQGDTYKYILLPRAAQPMGVWPHE